MIKSFEQRSVSSEDLALVVNLITRAVFFYSGDAPHTENKHSL